MAKKKRGKKCPPGKIPVTRKGYKRKGSKGRKGAKVKGSRFCIKDRGRKGKTSFGAKGGTRARKKPLIRREGKLGGPGYTSKPDSQRHALLKKCVKKYGYRSCRGSLQALTLSTEIGTSVKRVLEEDLNWLQKEFGGPGSFGPRKKKGRKGNPDKVVEHGDDVYSFRGYDFELWQPGREWAATISPPKGKEFTVYAPTKREVLLVAIHEIKMATEPEYKKQHSIKNPDGTEAEVIECLCAMGFVEPATAYSDTQLANMLANGAC